MPRVTALKKLNSARDPGGRPAIISRDKVLDAARELPSHELTMNAVAQRIGVKTASLYYHFKSRQDLIAALGADLVRTLKVPQPDPVNWRRWLEQAATNLFEMLSSNPVFLELENINQYTRAGLQLQESAMETLEEAGFDRVETLRIWSVVTSFAYVAATNEQGARHIDVDSYKRETMQLLAEAERTRPMPRVRSLIERASNSNSRLRFTETLAWHIQMLPDPKRSMASKRLRK